MPISHKHKAIFVHIPKCAGTTIEHYLLSDLMEKRQKNKQKSKWMYAKKYLWGGGPGANMFWNGHWKHNEWTDAVQHLPIKYIQRVVDDKTYNNYYKFTFVRNPWARAVSDYYWLMADFPGQPMRNAIKYSFELDVNSTFTDYVRQMINIPKKHPLHARGRKYLDKNKRHVHLNIPQKEYIVDDNGNNVMDYIGRVENFDNDFQKICTKLNIKYSSKFDRYNSPDAPNLPSRGHYTDHYTDETKQIIDTVYKCDIEYFNYKYGD